MIYGYLRVSTDLQTVENQRFEVNKYAETKGLKVEKWYEETISGTRKKTVGEIAKLLKKLGKGDVVIVSELSRIGRNLLEVMSILKECMDKEVVIFAVKEGFELGDNINSKVLAFAFGLAAEIERNMISQRTKEALARLKSEGKILGRPVGAKSSKTKLTGKDDYIIECLKKGMSKAAIARKLKVHRQTVRTYVTNKPILLHAYDS